MSRIAHPSHPTEVFERGEWPEPRARPVGVVGTATGMAGPAPGVAGPVRVAGPAGLGRLLVAFRVGRGWSQEELANRSGLSVRAIRDLERGHVRRPRRASVALLADAFGLTDAERGAVAAAVREPGAAAELARLCAGLPLALRIAAAKLTSHRQPIADYLTELAAGNPLSALETGGDEQAAVRTAFDTSYHGLPAAAQPPSQQLRRWHRRWRVDCLTGPSAGPAYSGRL